MADSTEGMSSVARISPSETVWFAATSTSSISTPSGTVTVLVSTSLMVPVPVTRVLTLP